MEDPDGRVGGDSTASLRLGHLALRISAGSRQQSRHARRTQAGPSARHDDPLCRYGWNVLASPTLRRCTLPGLQPFSPPLNKRHPRRGQPHRLTAPPHKRILTSATANRSARKKVKLVDKGNTAGPKVARASREPRRQSSNAVFKNGVGAGAMRTTKWTALFTTTQRISRNSRPALAKMPRACTPTVGSKKSSQLPMPTRRPNGDHPREARGKVSQRPPRQNIPWLGRPGSATSPSQTRHLRLEGAVVISSQNEDKGRNINSAFANWRGRRRQRPHHHSACAGFSGSRCQFQRLNARQA